MDWIAELLLRALLGAILITSAVPKLHRRAEFVQVVRDYQLLDRRSARAVGLVLPWLELITGLALLLGAGQPLPALAAAGLFAIFTGALSINLLRGRRDLSCGCFKHPPEGETGRLHWPLAFRAAGLATLALLLAVLDPATLSLDRTLRGAPIEPSAGVQLAVFGAGLLAMLVLAAAVEVLRLVRAGSSLTAHEAGPDGGPSTASYAAPPRPPVSPPDAPSAPSTRHSSTSSAQSTQRSR